ncbi:MAG: hypothetical protein JNK05_09625 [Myxococcales bacterium]|nr:hypothetical protein [Myxococcales bacterium]
MAHASSRAIVALALACSLVNALPVAAQSVAPTYPRPSILPIPPRDLPPTPPVIVRPPPQNQACTTGDCVSYNLSTQDECVMFDRQATGDQRWAAGLSLDADSELFVERGQRQWNVTAYRLRWFNGAWSGWYVAGVNDLDHKFNPGNNTMRRMWSYFADHEHQALACHRRQ